VLAEIFFGIGRNSSKGSDVLQKYQWKAEEIKNDLTNTNWKASNVLYNVDYSKHSKEGFLEGICTNLL
jgi:hypothetical protein